LLTTFYDSSEKHMLATPLMLLFSLLPIAYPPTYVQ